jgi:hypothetical protein
MRPHPRFFIPEARRAPVERAVDVHRHHRLPLGVVGRLGLVVGEHPGIVHEDVHGPEDSLHLLVGIANRVGARDVAHHGDGRPANEADHSVEAHRVDVDERHLRAVLEERAHDGEPHGARGTRDDGGFSGEIHSRIMRPARFSFRRARAREP